MRVSRSIGSDEETHRFGIRVAGKCWSAGLIGAARLYYDGECPKAITSFVVEMKNRN